MPEPHRRAALRISRLTSGYGGGVTLDQLDLHVRDGEAIAILGHNGAGKTTLFKTIMGLIRPQAGTISLFDVDISRLAPFTIARHGIGFVPQGREIFGDLTVDENLLLGRLSAPNADEVYAHFPALAAKRHQAAGRLSGGQHQQLAVARALMGRPRLLLLDEPSEGVQPSIIEELADILAGIAASRHMTLIIAEQNLKMVYRLCDRAVFLDRGRIGSEETIEALKSTPGLVESYLAL